MFKVDQLEIDGFWHRFDVRCKFNDDVNIIIGRNGTGKTTFMNILHSILTVELNGLSENEFDSAKVTLIEGAKKKTIKVTKIDESYPFPIVEYQISRSKYRLRIATDDSRFSAGIRRRIYEDSLEVRNELDKLTSVSSLSVYRLRHDDEYEVRDRHGSRMVMSPVDYRLSQALSKLTEFQLDLAQDAQRVSRSLQKEVLASILYNEDDAVEEGWKLSFDKENEQSSLVSAYTQLNAMDSDIRKKIRYHVSAIDKSISEIVESRSNDRSSGSAIDIKPLEALRKTRRIIDLSLAAKEETQEIYSPIDLFLEIIKDFISDKEFLFVSGRLVIRNEFGEIDHAKLSSGEKQLIILMVEALLQKKEQHIFLADEPELSLHIAWQRKIIPAETVDKSV